MVQQVSDAELEIMRIIWAAGGVAYFAGIMEQLGRRGKTWQKNTVITLLARLMDKGVLQSKKLGRRNEYTALVSEQEYQTMQTKSFVDKIYEGSVRGLVSNLIKGDLLTPDEYKELKKLIQEEGEGE